jgi:serine protease Do
MRSYIISVCLILTLSPLSAGTEVPGKVYPLLISELEKEVIRWLVQSGYEVQRRAFQTEQIELKATKEERSWEIHLSPHTPLATRVRADYMLGGQADETGLQELWSHISVYIKKRSINMEDPNQVIPSEVLSRIEAVVCIETSTAEEESQISGLIAGQEGLIICTAHTLGGCETCNITFYDGREAEAHLIKMDLYRDLAILQLDFELDVFIPLASGRSLLGMGERVYSIGCPNNLRGTVHSGVINGPPRLSNGLPLWQIEMKIYPGSSGSPVFDVQGNLVAIVKGRYRGTDSIGFLIPLETIIDFVKESRLL